MCVCEVISHFYRLPGHCPLPSLPPPSSERERERDKKAVLTYKDQLSAVSVKAETGEEGVACVVAHLKNGWGRGEEGEEKRTFS